LVAIQEFNLGPSITELTQYMILLTLQNFYNHLDSRSLSFQLFTEFQLLAVSMSGHVYHILYDWFHRTKQEEASLRKIRCGPWTIEY
jgi:hypothetical protein